MPDQRAGDERKRYGACLDQHTEQVGHLDALFIRICECECHDESRKAKAAMNADVGPEV